MSDQATDVYNEMNMLRELEDLIRTANEFGMLRYDQYSDSAYRIIYQINELLENIEDFRADSV